MNSIQRFLEELHYDDVPLLVRDQAVRCLYDLVATAAAGSETQLSRIIHRHVQQQFAAPAQGPGAPPLLGGNPVSASGAALAGGMMIDAIDAHDGHRLTKGHVGCALLPGLVALIEATGKQLSGTEFITLLVAGYEIGTRAGIALHATAPDYHTSGAWSAVNCAALGAHLMGASEEQFAHAIGIAEYQGPRSQMMRGVDHPTMLKDGSGWGAMAGVSAAFLAMDGFTGAPALTVTDSKVETIWADLGANWRILEQYFKPYPCCRWVHPGIDATLSVTRGRAIDPDQIDAIQVHTFHEATRLNQGIPANTEQAQYATAFPIAAALVHGKVDVAQIDGLGLTDPATLAMCSRISLVEHEAYNRVFPAERWAHVTIALKDGSLLTSEPHTAVGDPDNPLTAGRLEAKYASLTHPVWGEEKAQRVMDATRFLLENDSTLAQYLDTLRH
ncbi:MAG: 2-methylcitrate dehydratase PrpD [Motiliproteus sp.]|jgi:2-methylcitrate dehydratase PrpD